MPLVHSDSEGTVLACPECDTAGDVYERECHTNTTVGDPDAPYRCQTCSATFHEPVERDKKPPGPVDNPLEDLDPEDLGLSPIGER